MNISEWYESLPKRADVRVLLPGQWQSAPPQPVVRERELWLYVPFQRVWAEEDALCCSPALGEMWFYGSAKKIGLFCDLQKSQGADAQAVMDRIKTGESGIYRSNLALKRYLLALDDLEERMAQSGAPAPRQLEECNALLKQSLLIPGQWALYEGMKP